MAICTPIVAYYTESNLLLTDTRMNEMPFKEYGLQALRKIKSSYSLRLAD